MCRCRPSSLTIVDPNNLPVAVYPGDVRQNRITRELLAFIVIDCYRTYGPDVYGASLGKRLGSLDGHEEHYLLLRFPPRLRLRFPPRFSPGKGMSCPSARASLIWIALAWAGFVTIGPFLDPECNRPSLNFFDTSLAGTGPPRPIGPYSSTFISYSIFSRRGMDRISSAASPAFRNP